MATQSKIEIYLILKILLYLKDFFTFEYQENIHWIIKLK